MNWSSFFYGAGSAFLFVLMVLFRVDRLVRSIGRGAKASFVICFIWKPKPGYSRIACALHFPKHLPHQIWEFIRVEWWDGAELTIHRMDDSNGVK